jgi:hypothetical protein
MAEVTELSFVGDWRVTVINRDAGWSQRAVMRGTAAGDLVLPGSPGMSVDVFGNGQQPWTLHIDHNDGSGWQPNWLRATTSLGGAAYEFLVGAEDVTTSASDLDFNDLVVRLDKLGMVSQDVPPFAIRPETLQAMPEGIFEATLGRYFMAVRVTNIWTLTWPASARVGLSDRCRAWLAAAGVQVVDAWSANDQASVGQTVVNGRVAVGALAPWQSKLIYFKVDVSAAQVRKHQVELQVATDQGDEAVALINKAAKAPISVSRTTYVSTAGVFVSECDVGTLTASIKELTVDLSTFKQAIAAARKIVSGSTPGTGGTGGATGGCDPQSMERLREQLRAFINGKDIDLCALWRQLACCCAGGGGGPGDDGGDWTGSAPGIAFFAWPTVVDYTIDYRVPFSGQYGPFPYDDPWWKILLIIIAILLTLAAWASSTADLANRSDSVVIGSVTRSVLNSLSTKPTVNPAPSDPGSIDAAVATLNGHRTLSPAMFTLLDAQSGEFFTATPIVALDGRIDTPGTFLTNAQINALFQNLADNPDDPAAQAALRVYKSGARSGLGLGQLTTMMASLIPIAGRVDDGVTRFFLNQLKIFQDADSTDSLSCKGDSGSLWFQQGTNAVIALNHAGPTDESGSSATACRIEDVINQLGIRFA